MNVITPLAIVPSMIKAGTTIPALDTGETAWVSGGNYAADVEKVYDGQIYVCVMAHTGRTTVPPADAGYWEFARPTNRMAPFDYYENTQAKATTSLTYVVQVPFCNAVSVYGMVGTSYSMLVKDAPGGTLMREYTGDLYEPAVGLYELLFVPLEPLQKIVIRDIPISPTAEITFTISAALGLPVALGTWNLGNRMPLFGFGDWGGTEFGAEVELPTNSIVKRGLDGTIKIIKRPSSTNMRATVLMPRAQADTVVRILKRIKDQPVSAIGSDVPGFDGLNVFGLLRGTVRYESAVRARLTLTVEGTIE
jgi:hypothetical protein